MAITLKPEWVNAAQKWLRPLRTGTDTGRMGYRYGIGGTEAPATRITQACVWALHSHQTRWPDQMTYALTLRALEDRIRADRKRDVAALRRMRRALPVDAVPMPAYRGLRPFVPGPIPWNPEDQPVRKQKRRGPLFQAGPPEDQAGPVHVDARPATPIGDRMLQEDRGIRPAVHKPVHVCDGDHGPLAALMRGDLLCRCGQWYHSATAAAERRSPRPETERQWALRAATRIPGRAARRPVHVDAPPPIEVASPVRADVSALRIAAAAINARRL